MLEDSLFRYRSNRYDLTHLGAKIAPLQEHRRTTIPEQITARAGA